MVWNELGLSHRMAKWRELTLFGNEVTEIALTHNAVKNFARIILVTEKFNGNFFPRLTRNEMFFLIVIYISIVLIP